MGASSRGKLSELENAPSCVLTEQNEPEHAPGAKPLVCIGLYCIPLPFMKFSHYKLNF